MAISVFHTATDSGSVPVTSLPASVTAGDVLWLITSSLTGSSPPPTSTFAVGGSAMTNIVPWYLVTTTPAANTNGCVALWSYALTGAESAFAQVTKNGGTDNGYPQALSHFILTGASGASGAVNADWADDSGSRNPPEALLFSAAPLATQIALFHNHGKFARSNLQSTVTLDAALTVAGNDASHLDASYDQVSKSGYILGPHAGPYTNTFVDTDGDTLAAFVAVECLIGGELAVGHSRVVPHRLRVHDLPYDLRTIRLGGE